MAPDLEALTTRKKAIAVVRATIVTMLQPNQSILVQPKIKDENLKLDLKLADCNFNQIQRENRIFTFFLWAVETD